MQLSNCEFLNSGAIERVTEDKEGLMIPLCSE